MEAEGIPSVVEASNPVVVEHNVNNGEDSSKNFSHRQLDDIQKSILKHQIQDGKVTVKTPQCEARGGKGAINMNLLQQAVVQLEEAIPVPSGSPPHRQSPPKHHQSSCPKPIEQFDIERNFFQLNSDEDVIDEERLGPQFNNKVLHESTIEDEAVGSDNHHTQQVGAGDQYHYERSVCLNSLEKYFKSK